MPRKRSILQDKPAAKREAPKPRAPKEVQAARNGGKGRLIGAHVSEAAYKQVRLLAAELDMKNNELLRAALNAFLKENGKSPIA
jgi:hypothetical protein